MSSPISVEYSKLYRLSDPFATRPFRLRDRLPIGALPGARSHLLAQGKFVFDEPIQFDAASGGHATDVLRSQDPLLFCVSGRLIRLLEENEITGWSTYAVEVYDRQGAFLPDYHGFAITGTVCEPDYSRSAVIDKPPRFPGAEGYQIYKGLYFDESQWDGSDMFWVGMGKRVIVDRVYRLFRKHKIRNTLFTPLTEYEINVSNTRPLNVLPITRFLKF